MLPEAEITKYLLTQGVLGFTLLLSLIVNVVLWRDNHRKDLKAEEIQEARFAESREDKKARLETDQRIAVAMEMMNSKIEIGKARR